MINHKNQKLTAQTIFAIAIPLVIFIFLGITVMAHGHLHEDAYILFIYSENLAEFGEINYFEGGPPAEGATDFLWMVTIAVLNYLGISSGSSALLLNTLGALVFFFVIKFICDTKNGHPIVLLVICTYIVLSPIALASYGGFSTILFCSLIALIFSLILYSKDAKFLLVAPLALVLALIRPDGAVIAAGFIFVSLFLAPVAHRKQHYFLVIAFILLCSVYFVWRWNYFGAFLPLPLIVKSSTDQTLPGLRPHLDWLLSNFTLFSLALLGALAKSRTYFYQFLFASTPIIIYFALTSLTVQSQNFGSRFQAPFLAPLLIGATIALSHFMPKHTKLPRSNMDLTLAMFLFLILVPTFIDSMRRTSAAIEGLTKKDYINYFPVLLDEILPANVSIVLTEAGRLAYWTKGAKYDLVGLNTIETAVNGADYSFISRLSPDIVMAHQNGLFPGYMCESEKDFCLLSKEEFRRMVRESSVLERLTSENRVARAAAAAAAFLYENNHDYDIYFVRYGTGFSHFYGVESNGIIERSQFMEALSASFSEEHRASYFDLIRVRTH